MNNISKLGKPSALHTLSIEEKLERFKQIEKCYKKELEKWDSDFQENLPEVVQKIAHDIFSEMVDVASDMLSEPLSGNMSKTIEYYFDAFEDERLKTVDEFHKLSTHIENFHPFVEWKQIIQQRSSNELDKRYLDEKLTTLKSIAEDAISNLAKSFESEFVRLEIERPHNVYGQNPCLRATVVKLPSKITLPQNLHSDGYNSDGYNFDKVT